MSEERERLRDKVHKGRVVAHKRSRNRSRVLDGDAEAQLIAIACSEPLEG